MKNLKKLFIFIILIFIIAISPFWFKGRVLKVKNINIISSNIEIVKANINEFKMVKVDKPDIPSIKGIFYNPYEDSLNYLHLDIDQKNWFLTITSPYGKIIKSICLISHNVNNEGYEKVIFDKDNIYIGIEDVLLIINKADYSINKITLPSQKYIIRSEFLPSKDTNTGEVLDIEKVGNYIAISRDNANSILLYNLDNKKFEEWKLPDKFGSINKLIKFDDDTIFITNFYSGKGEYLIQDQFAKLNLITKIFDIFDKPVQKLFVLDKNIYGVDLNGNLFTLDKDLREIKTYDLNVFITCGIIPSNEKIWFVGSDIDSINGEPLISEIDDNPPMDVTQILSLETDKQIFFVGYFDPKDGEIRKSYLPLSKPHPVYGVFSPDLNLEDINKELKSSIVIPKGMVDVGINGVFLFSGMVNKILQITP